MIVQLERHEHPADSPMRALRCPVASLPSPSTSGRPNASGEPSSAHRYGFDAPVFRFFAALAFAHRVSTAFRAISERFSAGIFSHPRFAARFLPPILPRPTAAGFLRCAMLSTIAYASARV